MFHVIVRSSGRARLSPDLISKSLLSYRHTAPMEFIVINYVNPHSHRFMANQTQPSQPWINPANRVPGQALKQFSIDLTQLAEENKLDPVIGRHEEIRRALQILARRTKSNPVLIGEVRDSDVAWRPIITHHDFLRFNRLRQALARQLLPKA